MTLTELTEPAIPLYHSFPIIKIRLGTRVFKMADEANFQPLESKIALARRELNNLRSDMYSMKRMFAQKLKEIKEMVETGEFPIWGRRSRGGKTKLLAMDQQICCEERNCTFDFSYKRLRIFLRIIFKCYRQICMTCREKQKSLLTSGCSSEDICLKYAIRTEIRSDCRIPGPTSRTRLFCYRGTAVEWIVEETKNKLLLPRSAVP